MAPLEGFTLNDFNAETVQGYRIYYSSARPGHPWEKLPTEEYLERIGAAGRLRENGELRPTAAGLLMFGEEYRIVRYFPEYFLDYRESFDPATRWTNRIHSSSGDWSGNLFDFFFRVYNRLVMDVEKPFALNGVSRVDDTPIHKAIREALANCIVNADFYLPRGIVVLKDRDRIVIQNPGSIRTGKAQMLRGGISDPRNKAIMKMLNLVGIGERAGSGVPGVFSAWKDKGWSSPNVEEEYNPDRTILTLPLAGIRDEKNVLLPMNGANPGLNEANPDQNETNWATNGANGVTNRTKKATNGVTNESNGVTNRAKKVTNGAKKATSGVTNEANGVTNEVTNESNGATNGANKATSRATDRERRVLQLLSEDPGYTMTQLADLLDVSRKTIAKYLKSLKEEGVIERVGKTKGGHWKIRR